MSIKLERAIRDWSGRQPRDVCTAFLYRMALREAPFFVIQGTVFSPDFALAGLRGIMTSGVGALRPSPELATAAEAACAALENARETATSALKAKADDAAGAVQAVFRTKLVETAGSGSVQEPIHSYLSDIAHRVDHPVMAAAYDEVHRSVCGDPMVRAAHRAARVAGVAARCNVANTDAEVASFLKDAVTEVGKRISTPPRVPNIPYNQALEDADADRELEFHALMTESFIRSEVLEARLLAAERFTACVVDTETPWAFWAKWYAAALRGEPLPWDLQEQIALIPEATWAAGPEALANEIARIEVLFAPRGKWLRQSIMRLFVRLKALLT